MLLVDPPMTGVWEWDAFPDFVSIDGVEFHRANRKQSYDGVIEQYRGVSEYDSPHLFVLEDGTWRIDHIDRYNPDMGHPVRHFLVDHPRGPGVVTAALGAAAIGASVVYGKAKEANASGKENKS